MNPFKHFVVTVQREYKLASRFCHIGIHIGLIPAEPVKIRPGRFKSFIIGTKGHFINELAPEMPALYCCNHSGQAAAHRRQHRRVIPVPIIIAPSTLSPCSIRKYRVRKDPMLCPRI